MPCVPASLRPNTLFSMLQMKQGVCARVGSGTHHWPFTVRWEPVHLPASEQGYSHLWLSKKSLRITDAAARPLKSPAGPQLSLHGGGQMQLQPNFGVARLLMCLLCT